MPLAMHGSHPVCLILYIIKQEVFLWRFFSFYFCNQLSYDIALYKLLGRRFHIGSIHGVDVICVLSGQRRVCICYQFATYPHYTWLWWLYSPVKLDSILQSKQFHTKNWFINSYAHIDRTKISPKPYWT